MTSRAARPADGGQSGRAVGRDRELLPALSFEIETAAAEPVGDRLAAFVDAYGVEPEVRARLVAVAPALARSLSRFAQRLRVEADIGAQDVQLVITSTEDHQLEVWARFSRT
jgi:hypothetical protein